MMYKYVFVVLVYKNTDVLSGFFDSVRKLDNCKVVLVNSYYDDESKARCKEYAVNNGCPFLDIENRGYGYGNNRGIEYALDHYDFRYLIVCNSDVIINDISKLGVIENDNCIIAPKIEMLTGKKQNPNLVFNDPFYAFFQHLYGKNGSYLFEKLSYISPRLCRELFQKYTSLRRKDKYSIFSPHGAFIIFTRKAVKTLAPVFDDEIFLYYEEYYLALKCKKNNIPVYYCPKIDITHLEGASTTKKKGVAHQRNSILIIEKRKKEGIL